MGQTYCIKLCGQNEPLSDYPLAVHINTEADQPIPKFAKKVRQHIEIHPKVKQTYLLYRTPHNSERRGVTLELYYLFQFGAYYEGNWKNGLPHGFGRIIYDDGSLYQGCFNNGIAQCFQALFISEKGGFYRGHIKNNKANGYGELSTHKLFYKGYWINDLPNGKARQIYNSNSFYEGQFFRGMKHGNGIYQWNPNDYYIGKFNQNRIQGKGNLITKQYSYKGQFKDGKKQGSGKYTDNTNKFIYIGCFQNDQPKGKGEINFSDGAKFVGQFDGFDKRRGSLKISDVSHQIDTFVQQSIISLAKSVIDIQSSEIEI